MKRKKKLSIYLFLKNLLAVNIMFILEYFKGKMTVFDVTIMLLLVLFPKNKCFYTCLLSAPLQVIKKGKLQRVLLFRN